ncbi:glycosyltransferase [Bacillus sp. 03113]|uniref:glycosyltransferase n=1 Tax=Bacillus sp. 03113 TaxID=2578211 RepID=UPI001144058A|nr:glycosyltransferase [Bacillus sp. 03113]
MDVCIINEAFNMGGVERVVIEMANYMKRKGNKVSLVDFSGVNSFYYEVEKGIKIPHVIRPINFKRKLIKRALYFKYKVNKNSLNIFQMFKEQTEDLIEYLSNSKHEILILCQGVLTALIPILKKRVPNIKIVAWQHNDFDVYTSKYYKEFILDYKLGVEKADLVVCLTANDLEKFKKLNTKSCFIYNPLTISDPQISTLNHKNIIFVGRLLIQQKGLDFLIKIGHELENGWRILVAGEGLDKEKFRNMISENELEEKIILKGSLKSKELGKFYSSGSIFISTSRWEGFGLVITEAMACGLPIISFSNSGPKEILNNGTYGILINDYDINQFIDKLKNLIIKKESREYFQSLSLERVKDFKMDVIIREWETNLNKLLKSTYS